MKLSLNELRVDSYAAQLSEVELTLVKGGDGAVTYPVIGQDTSDIGFPSTQWPHSEMEGMHDKEREHHTNP